MLVNAKLFALAALFFAGVHAQSSATTTGSAAVPTSTADIPKCVLSCVQAGLQATGGSCTSFTDPCVCTNAQFQQAAGQCLASKCSAADQAAALQLQKSFCGSISGSGSSSAAASTSAASSGASSPANPSGTATASGSGSASKSGSASGSATSASSSATHSNAAAGNKASFGQTGLVALGISVAGAALGGMML